jgi:phosphinothricin acetyltransferase
MQRRYAELMEVRVVTEDDADAVLAIYGPIVRDTAISFEDDVPSVEELRRRISETLETYPWFVAEEDGELLGYGYAGPLRTRAAYRWSAEVSMYVRPDAQHKGVGTAIGMILTESLLRMGVVNLFGGTTLPNPASEGIYLKSGFEQTGVWRNAGFKLGRWHDVGWYQRRIREVEGEPPQFIPFSQL